MTPRAILLLLATGCSGPTPDTATEDSAPDAESDADTDADTDADSDTDTDTDTDTIEHDGQVIDTLTGTITWRTWVDGVVWCDADIALALVEAGATDCPGPAPEAFEEWGCKWIAGVEGTVVRDDGDPGCFAAQTFPDERAWTLQPHDAVATDFSLVWFLPEWDSNPHLYVQLAYGAVVEQGVWAERLTEDDVHGNPALSVVSNDSAVVMSWHEDPNFDPVQVDHDGDGVRSTYDIAFTGSFEYTASPVRP